MKTTITTTLLYVGTAVLAFFAPIVYAFIFTCILVAVDTITGVMKLNAENKQEKDGWQWHDEPPQEFIDWQEGENSAKLT
jgi:uncharacterized membrane protein HdeD (DUF308 family)